MPIQKPWKRAYVCLCCCLKSNRRPFSSSLKHSDATVASQEAVGSSSFDNQYFRRIPSSSPVTQTDGNCDGGSSRNTQPISQGQEDGAEPSSKPKIGRSRKVVLRPRLLATQLHSIATLTRVTKKLFEASQLSGSIESAVEQALQQTTNLPEKRLIATLSNIYSGKTVEDVARDINVLQKLNRRSSVDEPTEQLVAKLTRTGLLKAPPQSLWHRQALQNDSAPTSVEDKQTLHSSPVTSPAKRKANKPSARELRRLRNEEKLRKKETAALKEVEATGSESTAGKKEDAISSTSKEKHEFTSSVDANALSISQFPRTGPAVPSLCHDLSRVLFNPGIYQLQDPRSRVYNFDPYLEKIMPVSEFDFKILKEYITSSRDTNLRSLALEHGKKYVGSSSSMTATLGQFHFLLSQWRDISTEALSRGFSDTLKSFTLIQRSPSSVFLRYKDGVYAMDADKEYDSGNILMSLGKSMEKFLTQEPQLYERYRKTSEVKIPEEEQNAPEAYQYTHAGDFLMRAQLDAYDARLPGTGTFDLKTRAVASIRHNIKQHEEGFGYQIKTRFGDWESYEREYFDMMRSAFLKYSLQVRLGLMDGIFVAFHNVERIFGFQYICLPEMDMALHGQYDTTLGDQEFKLSVELLNRVLNRITERFPERSLRLQFETRDLPAGGVFMQIFAEPMDEESIEAIQTSRKEAIDAFEQRLMNPEAYTHVDESNDIDSTSEQQDPSHELERASSTPSASAGPRDAAAPPVGSTLNEQPAREDSPVKGVEHAASDGQPGSENAPEDLPATEAPKATVPTDPTMELLAFKLRIQSNVNGKIVKRPIKLTSSDNWSIDYSLEEETRQGHAQAQYRASKARRKTTLEQKAEDPAANYYLRKLREMASRGAEWRKAQDELDAGRERVVLYDD
jgi:Mitochondrial protein Pet127